MDATTLASPRPAVFRMGRMFVNPAFDYLLIGGAASFLVVGLIAYMGPIGVTTEQVGYLLLLSNWTHFAASSMRLYTKPGAVRALPFLALGFPVVAVLASTFAVAVGEPFSRYVIATYIFWSPFHYAAQAYGLALMYAYRSGTSLALADKRLLRWTCLMPFLWTLLQPEGGLAWIAPTPVYADYPTLDAIRLGLSRGLWAVSLAAPVLVFLRLRDAGATLPLISLVIIYTNGMWFLFFTYLNAFFWATVFHGIQYLAIAMIVHIRDQTGLSSNRRGGAYHAVTFYAASLTLGYVLFALWPHAYRLVGFDMTLSVWVVTATINIHHFVVDAYIWRLSRDPSYRSLAPVADAPASA